MSARASYDQTPGRDRPDFEFLADAFYAPLYRFAMTLAHTETDAADLVQETFLTWATRGHQLKDPARVKSWLYTTLHRRFLEGQRRVVRFPHQEISAAEAELPDVDPLVVQNLDGRTACEYLGRVDPQYRAAVSLFYLEDYSYPEIAAILEVPLGTVKSRIARGLGQLKALLADARPPARVPKEVP